MIPTYNNSIFSFSSMDFINSLHWLWSCSKFVVIVPVSKWHLLSPLNPPPPLGDPQFAITNNCEERKVMYIHPAKNKVTLLYYIAILNMLNTLYHYNQQAKIQHLNFQINNCVNTSQYKISAHASPRSSVFCLVENHRGTCMLLLYTLPKSVYSLINTAYFFGILNNVNYQTKV